MGDDFNRILILADYGSINLAKRIHDELSKRGMHGGLEPFDPEGLYINRFAGGEIDGYITSSVRGRDIFLVKSFNVYPERWEKDERGPPTLDELVYKSTEGYGELFELNDALKRAEARSITNIMPHMPYQRQDRRPTRKGDFIRGPISAKLYADLLKTSGADRVITLDPHFAQIEGFYDIPVNKLETFVLNAEYIENNFTEKMDEITFCAPDFGAVKMVRSYTKYFKRPMVIVDKVREEEGKAKVYQIIGDPKDVIGKTILMLDDLVDTAGTLCEGADKLKSEGAKKIITFGTHPVLSKDAKDKLLSRDIQLVTTNSILVKDKHKYPNIVVLDTSYVIAGAMDCICNGHSISHNLVDYKEYKENKRKRKTTP